MARRFLVLIVLICLDVIFGDVVNAMNIFRSGPPQWLSDTMWTTCSFGFLISMVGLMILLLALRTEKERGLINRGV